VAGKVTACGEIKPAAARQPGGHARPGGDHAVSFIGLGVGLAMAIVLVYLLMVVNFQSWIDAAIIIAALPAALAGIAWMLFITGTTLSVPA
jgi:multidrug efflux pump subunit AcrB